MSDNWQDQVGTVPINYNSHMIQKCFGSSKQLNLLTKKRKKKQKTKQNPQKMHSHLKNQKNHNKTKANKITTKKPRALHYTDVRAIKIHILS